MSPSFLFHLKNLFPERGDDDDFGTYKGYALEEGRIVRRLVSYSDMLKSYSTIPGYKANRFGLQIFLVL